MVKQNNEKKELYYGKDNKGGYSIYIPSINSSEWFCSYNAILKTYSKKFYNFINSDKIN